MRLTLWESKDGWRVTLRFANGRIFATSEAYASKNKARRAAIRVYWLLQEGTGTVEE